MCVPVCGGQVRQCTTVVWCAHGMVWVQDVVCAYGMVWVQDVVCVSVAVCGVQDAVCMRPTFLLKPAEQFWPALPVHDSHKLVKGHVCSTAVVQGKVCVQYSMGCRACYVCGRVFGVRM